MPNATTTTKLSPTLKPTSKSLLYSCTPQSFLSYSTSQTSATQGYKVTSKKTLFDALTTHIECIFQELVVILQSNPQVLSKSLSFTSQKVCPTCFQATSYMAWSWFIDLWRYETTSLAFYKFSQWGFNCYFLMVCLRHAPTPSCGPFPRHVPQ